MKIFFFILLLTLFVFITSEILASGRITLNSASLFGCSHAIENPPQITSIQTRAKKMTTPKYRSFTITQGNERAPNRSMLRGIGYQDDDFKKPFIGLANGHSTLNPCNAGIQPLADAADKAIREAGGMPQMFGTITVTDGISMGTEGMKYSLVSREVIADSIETACQSQFMDGVIAIGACDKNLPGAMIGVLRMNIPAIMVYGGTIKPGHYKGQDLQVVSVFEAVGAFNAGKMSEEDFGCIERCAIPGVGACGGMYTANTMSSACEAIGMSLPFSSTMAAEDEEKKDSAAESARVLLAADRATSSPANHSRMPSPSSWPWAAPPMQCCTSSLSPTRPMWSGPSMISSACGRLCR